MRHENAAQPYNQPDQPDGRRVISTLGSTEITLLKLIIIFVATFLTTQVCAAVAQSTPHASTQAPPTPPLSSDTTALKLEREKFEYQQQLESQKLEVERLKAWLTGGSILLPLALGVFTLVWQTRTANKHKDRDAKDMFELKATEILFEGDSTTATKNRAKALTVLFPGRFPENFGEAFEPTQFGGPRYEAKLEVFKAACSKVQTPEEVYRIWHSIYPGDQWIKHLVPELAGKKRR